LSIVTISRIQHRRGLYENLPQLASAEIGWALDQRRLFIGNGALTEGAPVLGNTEILTEFSNVLDVANSYIFKNAIAGYTPSTGPDANSPTVRTLQEKFDDFASVRDFGAKGNGETDDTAAINRALFELYCRESFEGAKKALYFPAGKYLVSDTIKIPPDTTILGEGPNSSVVEMMMGVGTEITLLQTADSLQQVGASAGTNGADLPRDISVLNMGFNSNLEALRIEKTKRITFERCKFTGPENFPDQIDNIIAGRPAIAVYLSGTASIPSEDINFKDCFFNKFNVGIWSNFGQFETHNVNISSATFDNMYKAILIGILGGTAKNFVVTNSVFNDIYEQAIEVDDINNFISSFNYFKNCGNHYQGTGSPITNVIKIGSSCTNSASIGDEFERPDSDNLAVARVSIGSNSSFYNYGTKNNSGYLATHNGNFITLTNNTTLGDVGVEWDYLSFGSGELFYSLTRDGEVRSGRLTIVGNGTTWSVDDDSTETSDIGVIFRAVFSNGKLVLKYTTTNIGSDVEMFYSLRQLSDVV
jgi:hypothetical protein